MKSRKGGLGLVLAHSGGLQTRRPSPDAYEKITLTGKNNRFFWSGIFTNDPLRRKNNLSDILQVLFMTYEDRSEINIAIGKRIKMARRALRMSQTVLGQSVGLTFQQIQKYEHGSNRISAALLFALSRSLNVSLEYLYSDVCTFRTDADKVDPRLSQIMSEVERLSDDQKEHILAIATAINDQRTSRRYLKQAA